MVMPLSRSRSMSSRSWSCPNSRRVMVPVFRRSRSARVDFPWSMCAMMQKFRMWDWSTSAPGPRSGGDTGQSPEAFGKALESAGPMADRVLLLGIQLGVSLAQFRKEEERVVTEPGLAARGIQDPAPTFPASDEQDLRFDAGLGHGRAGHRGDEDGSAVLRLHRFKLLEEEEVVLPIRSAGPGKPGGANPRRAIEGVHAEAGIIADDPPRPFFRRKRCSRPGEGQRLQAGVLFEGPAVLDDSDGRGQDP